MSGLLTLSLGSLLNLFVLVLIAYFCWSTSCTFSLQLGLLGWWFRLDYKTPSMLLMAFRFAFQTSSPLNVCELSLEI